MAIFSNQLYNIVNNFDISHKAFDISIKTNNGTVLEKKYQALQILPQKDLVDLESSDYVANPILPEKILYFKKFILRDLDEKSFPIFRVKEVSARLFVNTELKTAIDAADIKGIEFISIEDYNWAR